MYQEKKGLFAILWGVMFFDKDFGNSKIDELSLSVHACSQVPNTCTVIQYIVILIGDTQS